MELDSILYIVYCTMSITITIILALLFWARRKASGASSMALMMSSAALWALCDFLSDLSSYLPAKIFWDNVSYFGVVTIPVAWFIFVLKYTKNEEFLKNRRLLLLFIIPVITVFFIWTDGFHQLMLSDTGFLGEGQMIILETGYGPWFWVHAAYSYLLFFLGVFLLIKKLILLPKILQSQSIIILAAIFVPLLLSILYAFKIGPSYPIDPTIFSFTFGGIICFFGMFRYRLFELVPAARDLVIEDMSSILVVLDNHNHIIDINSAAKDVFDIRIKDFVGQSFFDILGEQYSNIKKHEYTQKAEEKISIDSKEGRKCFDLRIAPLFDGRNRTAGRFFILYDITALEAAIDGLEESRKAAEDANKAKSHFLATMSHEIRTPLNGIIGMTELLTSVDHSDEEKGYLQIVQNCAESLLDIINDILDFSKIEAGRMELERTGFNLRSLIDGAVNSFYHQAMEKNIDFVCSIDQAIPENLEGDPLRTRQVLVNLVGNAFKFTEKGRVEVKAEQIKCEKGQVAIRFSVTDTGIGVSEEKLSNLFKSFEQIDSSTTRKYGGTGLGLAIVKNLVGLMGGTVDVESKPDEGSRFTFIIPFKISDNIIPKENTVSEFDFSGRNISILLAEDNKVNQSLVSKLLEKEKVKVDIAENGREVLKALEKNAYDLILMDIMMPVMDGYETTKAIRTIEENTGNHVPIIALTANATEEDRNLCLKAGMDDYLTKPLRSRKLYECLSRYIIGTRI